MGGFFGVVSKKDCVADLYFGVDYHSHLGPRRGGLAVYGPDGYPGRGQNTGRRRGRIRRTGPGIASTRRNVRGGYRRRHSVLMIRL